MFFVTTGNQKQIQITVVEARTPENSLFSKNNFTGCSAQFIKSENKLDLVQGGQDHQDSTEETESDPKFSITVHTTHNALLYESPERDDAVLIVEYGGSVSLWILNEHRIVEVPTLNETQYANMSSVEHTDYGFNIVYTTMHTTDERKEFIKCIDLNVLLNRPKHRTSQVESLTYDTYPWINQCTNRWDKVEIPVLTIDQEMFDENRTRLFTNNEFQSTEIIGVYVVQGSQKDMQKLYTVHKMCEWAFTIREFSALMIAFKNYECIVINHTYQPKITVKGVGLFDLPITNAEHVKITKIEQNYDEDTFKYCINNFNFSFHTAIALDDIVGVKSFESNVVKHIRGRWIDGAFYQIRVFSDTFDPTACYGKDVCKIENSIFNTETYQWINPIGFLYPATNTLSLWSSSMSSSVSSSFMRSKPLNTVYQCSMMCNDRNCDDGFIVCCDLPTSYDTVKTTVPSKFKENTISSTKTEPKQKALYCFRTGINDVLQTVHILGSEFKKVEFTDTEVIVYYGFGPSEVIATLNKEELYNRELTEFLKDNLLDTIDLKEKMRIGVNHTERYVILVWSHNVTHSEKMFEKITLTAHYLSRSYPGRLFAHMMTSSEELWFYDKDQTKRCPNNTCTRSMYLNPVDHPRIKSIVVAGDFWIECVITLKDGTQRSFDVFTSYYTKSIMINDIVDLKTKDTLDVNNSELVNLQLKGVELFNESTNSNDTEELRLILQIHNNQACTNHGGDKERNFMCRLKLNSLLEN